MTQVFRTKETVIVSAITAQYISLPTFYLDERNKAYRATMECYNSDKKLVGMKEVFFTQEDYDAWGTDSEYIYNLIYSKLGIVRTDTTTIEI